MRNVTASTENNSGLAAAVVPDDHYGEISGDMLQARVYRLMPTPFPGRRNYLIETVGKILRRPAILAFNLYEIRILDRDL